MLLCGPIVQALCEVCVRGYSLNGDLCEPCDPRVVYANWSAERKAGLFFLTAVVGLFVVVFWILMPLFPRFETACHALLGGAVTAVKETSLVRGVTRRLSVMRPVPRAEKRRKDDKGGEAGSDEDDDGTHGAEQRRQPSRADSLHSIQTRSYELLMKRAQGLVRMHHHSFTKLHLMNW